MRFKMKILIFLIKILASFCILLGLCRGYMKEKPLYHKFRILQHILTFVTICALLMFYIFWVGKK